MVDEYGFWALWNWTVIHIEHLSSISPNLFLFLSTFGVKTLQHEYNQNGSPGRFPYSIPVGSLITTQMQGSLHLASSDFYKKETRFLPLNRMNTTYDSCIINEKKFFYFLSPYYNVTSI